MYPYIPTHAASSYNPPNQNGLSSAYGNQNFRHEQFAISRTNHIEGLRLGNGQLSVNQLHEWNIQPAYANQPYFNQHLLSHSFPAPTANSSQSTAPLSQTPFEPIRTDQREIIETMSADPEELWRNPTAPSVLQMDMLGANSGEVLHTTNPLTGRKRPYSPAWRQDANYPSSLQSSNPTRWIMENRGQAINSSNHSQRNFHEMGQMGHRAPYQPAQHMVTRQPGYPGTAQAKPTMRSAIQNDSHIVATEILKHSEQLSSSLFIDMCQTNPTQEGSATPTGVAIGSSGKGEAPDNNSQLGTQLIRGCDYSLQPSMFNPGTDVKKASNETKPSIPESEEESSDAREVQSANETKSSITDSETETSDARDVQFAFKCQVPEFKRKSPEMMKLIKETRNLLGVYSLDRAYITSAHVMRLAKDLISGYIHGETIDILWIAYLDSPSRNQANFKKKINKYKPEGSATDWYKKTEAKKIETEYLELKKVINKYLMKKNKSSLTENTSCKDVLKTAVDILQQEAKDNCDTLVKENEGNYLSVYLRICMEKKKQGGLFK